MSRLHLVRVGVLGHIGCFTSVDAISYPRGARVVCRTSRGLELGEVLAPADDALKDAASDGSLLRHVTVEDELLLARLGRYKNEAYRACTALLAERGIPAVLMDVEHLLDGQSLYFYFLGHITPQIEDVTEQLAEAYDAKVQFRRFTETLTRGCGPDCGTEAATGAGCDNTCAACAVAGACATKRSS